MQHEHPNKGRSPRDKNARIRVRWANGEVSRHSYTAGQLVWELRGWTHDIAAFWKAED